MGRSTESVIHSPLARRLRGYCNWGVDPRSENRGRVDPHDGRDTGRLGGTCGDVSTRWRVEVVAELATGARAEDDVGLDGHSARIVRTKSHHYRVAVKELVRAFEGGAGRQ